ncbi:glycoside hydrolase family 9 protein [Streptomyces zhihengii]
MPCWAASTTCWAATRSTSRTSPVTASATPQPASPALGPPARPEPAQPGTRLGRRRPNADIQDPVAQDKLQGCAPAMCYIDDIGSWATNEVTINWNAPLAWIASYVDDLGGSGTTDPDPATCEVDYASDRWNGASPAV